MNPDATQREREEAGNTSLQNASINVPPVKHSIFNTEPPILNLPPGTDFKTWLGDPSSPFGAMHLIWKSASERSEALIFQFAALGVPQQVFRWTGWSGKIGDRVDGLVTLHDAFSGVEGFHLFGGTQLRKLSDLSLIPSTGDVPIALRRDAIAAKNSKVVLVGIIPKVAEEPRYLAGLGVVLRVQKEVEKGKQAEYVTMINSDQNIGIVLQPDVNGHYEWIDEIRESLRQCERLAEKGWSSNLIVFGGSVTPDGAPKLRNVEQELVWWADLAERNPGQNINILLVRGSGGVADKYASNEAWLAQHPSVKVADLSVESLRSKILEMKGVTVNFPENGGVS